VLLTATVICSRMPYALFAEMTLPSIVASWTAPVMAMPSPVFPIGMLPLTFGPDVVALHAIAVGVVLATPLSVISTPIWLAAMNVGLRPRRRSRLPGEPFDAHPLAAIPSAPVPAVSVPILVGAHEVAGGVDFRLSADELEHPTQLPSSHSIRHVMSFTLIARARQ